MPIYKNNRVQRVFRGDHKPVRIYHGANKIAGWEEATATGQNVTADNTYNDAAHVEVQGNTELQSDYMECWGGSTQKTLTGKNLFDMDWSFSGDTRTHNGITFAKSADGVIASGTATAQAFTPPYEILDKLTVGKTYISSISCANVFPAFKYVENGTTLYATKLTITSSMTSVSIYYYIKADVTVNNALILLQIEEGETATDYEPYCGGKPSPNPDYPQAITPLVTAGTYKITTDYGIYEVTVPDLHGIGDVTDKVVFDAVSGKGYLLQKCGDISLTGNEPFGVQGTGANDYGVISYLSKIYGEKADPASTQPALSSILPYMRRSLSLAQQPSFMAQTDATSTMLYLRVLAADYPDAQSIKTKLAELATAGTPARIVWQLVTPIRTPLAFTKVETSTAAELPLHVFEDGTTIPPTSNTPSIDYPQTIVPASGTLTTSCGEKQSAQQIPPLYGIKNKDGTWAARDKLVIDDASKSAWIERNIGRTVFNSITNVTYNDQYGLYLYLDDGYAKTQTGYSTYFKLGVDASFASNAVGAWSQLRIAKSALPQTITDAASGIAWINSFNPPLEVAYEKTTPTIEPIDYIAAKTYYPQTVIELSSNLPMDMTTKYKHF